MSWLQNIYNNDNDNDDQDKNNNSKNDNIKIVACFDCCFHQPMNHPSGGSVDGRSCPNGPQIFPIPAFGSWLYSLFPQQNETNFM
jgi:hypothetical protein